MVKNTAFAMFWDGSMAEAGRIIEWIEAEGGIAEFKETNETSHRLHPEIRVRSGKGIRYAAYPEHWIVHINDGFEPMSQFKFEETFPQVTE